MAGNSSGVVRESGGEVIDWSRIRAVIFDVDGTLYDQRPLRLKMLRDLLFHYGLRPWRYRELMILQAFRNEREHRAGATGDLENAQYRWCAQKVGCQEEDARRVVDKWIFQHPNPYLRGVVYPGVHEFFNALRGSGRRIAIYSDYKAHDKLKAMDLRADLVVASTDPGVDRLKPDPRGLLVAAEKLGLPVDSCLFIGDREELDGECARRAGMPCLILEKDTSGSFNWYNRLIATIPDLFKEKTYGTSFNIA